MTQRATTDGGTAVSGLVTGPATGADVPGILAVLEDAFAPFAGEFRPTALKQTAGSVREGLGDWMVARRDGRVVACVMRYAERDALVVCFLSVRRELRGRGYADALVRAVLDGARANRFREVRVILRRTLPANVRYFAARGFRLLEPYETGAHDVYHLPLGVRREP